MLKAVTIVIVLGITAALAAVDDEHTFSANYRTIRLTRASLPVTRGSVSVVDPSVALEELSGNAVVREVRRSRKNRPRARKGNKSNRRRNSHQKRNRNRKIKYEDDANEHPSGKSMSWFPPAESDESYLDTVDKWEELDQAAPVANPEHIFNHQYPPPATPDFLEEDVTDGC